jgi:hypothetical protein
MSYTNDVSKLRQSADVMHRIAEAFVSSQGNLTLILQEGRAVRGALYGIHCNVSSSRKVSCKVSLGDEDGDYPGEFDLNDIAQVLNG